MKFRPILFSTPMVQALLNGRKSQTRRVFNVKHLHPDDIGSIHPDGSGKGWAAWLGTPIFSLTIHTLEGDMKAMSNDWIIKGVNGEFYPCKPDIFEKTYEAVKEEANAEALNEP